jgi:hypothetical protein
MPESTLKEPVLGRGLRLLISGAGSSTNTFAAEPDKDESVGWLGMMCETTYENVSTWMSSWL